MASFSVVKRDPDPLCLCAWPEDLEGNCILSVEGTDVHVNKPYLSMQSPVFHRMFYGDLSMPDNRHEVNDVDKEAFIEMLRVILPCRKRIDENNVESLLVMADRFEMDNLRKDCFAFKEAKEQQDKRERMYQMACRAAGEAELRAERAENQLDKKPTIVKEEVELVDGGKKKEELEKSLAELSKKLDASQFNEKKLEQENSSLKEKNLELREEIVKIKDERANLKDEKTSDREKIYELTRKVAQLESQVLIDDCGNSSNEISSGTSEMGKRKRASKMAHNSMEDSDENGRSAVKRRRIDGGREPSISQSTSPEPKIDAKRNDKDIECHLCEFPMRNAECCIKHLKGIHSTTLVQENMALLCECGNESQSSRHSYQCDIASFTLIKKTVSGPPTTPKCPMCEAHPTTVVSFISHIYKQHKTTLKAIKMYLTCSCGVVCRSFRVGHAKEECDGRKFTLHKEEDEK